MQEMAYFIGAPEGIRTPDLCLRRAALYPAELRAHARFDTPFPGRRAIRRAPDVIPQHAKMF
jgi:hypothetical protein